MVFLVRQTASSFLKMPSISMKCSCKLAVFPKSSQPPRFPVGHGLTKPNRGSAKHKAKEADYDSHLGFLSSAGTKRKGCVEN